MGRRRKTTRNRTRVFVVQDRSGSMSGLVNETISGFNEYVDTLDNTEIDDDVYLTLIQFDGDVNTVFSDRRLEDVRDLTHEDYVIGGMTALLDGVGRAISTAERTVSKDDKVLVVIMTDGGENSSREYNKTQILSKIKDKRRDGWEFVFLGAGEEAWDSGVQLFASVIPMQTHSINYGKTAAHTNAVYTSLGSVTNNLRSVPSGAATMDSAAFDVSVKSAIEDEAGSASLANSSA